MPAAQSLGIAEKKGKLRPIDMKKVAPTIRLVSSCQYERHIIEDKTGVPMNSTYRLTLADHAKNTEDMYNRCVSTRNEVRRHDMVRAAGRAIPPFTLDRFHEEVEKEYKQETLKREATVSLEATVSKLKSIPLITPAVETFSKTLSKEPRHPAIATMTQQFFSSGDAPFPSELGTVLAGSYWLDKPANSGLIMGPRQPRYAPDGNRLLNHNHMT